jgi:hypothetical protein
VAASIVSTGLNGGEILLTDIGEIPGTSAFEHLRTGQWIMLCGPHPNSTPVEPRLVLKWYQVLSIDSEGNGIEYFDPKMQRVVALRGPQWPWQPEAPADLDQYDRLSNSLCVGICQGAVAVHSKTMRLERSTGVTPFGVVGNAAMPQSPNGPH